jgi:hypothetical protein
MTPERRTETAEVAAEVAGDRLRAIEDIVALLDARDARRVESRKREQA